ncbi:MAG: methyltransferase domain-containing protein [Gemmatimonadetes bacterium]|nr:methyltransferase domain-containing protein [Gemmatimonadota bacterium]
MKPAALEYLACPDCGGDLELAVTVAEDAEVITGSLACPPCARQWPIHGGVPRFAGDIAGIEARTASAFGYEWTRYDELAARYRQQFLDWIRPLQPADFAGRVVLEGGCGKGRHTALVAEYGARAVLAIDLSDAVDAAFANTRAFGTVHVIQADLTRPPVKPLADLAFSIGVLHHLPEPQTGFVALLSRVRPAGRIAIWVYGREGNGWIVHVVTPIREHLTSRLPHRVLDWLAGALTLPLFAATRLLYAPTRGHRVAGLLPYAPYLSYIADFPFREQRSIVFDHLVAPVAHYLPRTEVAAWFERAGLADVTVAPHNANSWRACGRVPERANA